MDPGAAGRRCQPPPPRPSSCTSTVVSSGSSKLGGFYPSISQWGGCMVGSPGGYTSHLYPRLPPYLRGLTTSWLLTTYSDSGSHNQKVLGAKNAGTEAYQAILGVEFPLQSLTSAYMGEDSSVLGTWNVWWRSMMVVGVITSGDTYAFIKTSWKTFPRIKGYVVQIIPWLEKKRQKLSAHAYCRNFVQVVGWSSSKCLNFAFLTTLKGTITYSPKKVALLSRWYFPFGGICYFVPWRINHIS